MPNPWMHSEIRISTLTPQFCSPGALSQMLVPSHASLHMAPAYSLGFANDAVCTYCFLSKVYLGVARVSAHGLGHAFQERHATPLW